jgi:thioredoxin-dependent peroxiredoxin
MRARLLLVGLALLLGCHREPSAESRSTGSTTTTVGSAAGEELAVGKPAPDFSAKAHDGMAIQPSALKGKSVVLYFYPKDETPGCTKEACAFRDAWKDLEATGVVLVGISTDTEESHKKFAEHHQLPFHLVSDPDGSIAKAYGVPNRLGMLARQTIVIGPDGNVKKIYRTVDVSKHAAEILSDVKS